MFAKKFRLPASIIFQKAQTIGFPQLSIKYQENNLPHGRFGFVTSKTLDKRAAVRNRLKRLVRSCVEGKWETKSKGKDVLFILKPGLKMMTREEVRKKMQEVMEKITL